MIADTLQNIDLYSDISKDIYIGLQYIRDATPDIPLGTYQLNERVKVIITSYDTKNHNELGFEAHVDNVDIQYPIIGEERVYWSPITGNSIPDIKYNKEKDIAFYNFNHNSTPHIDIGNGIFIILFPNDAHSPQYCVNQIETLKKITIKIRIK